MTRAQKINKVIEAAYNLNFNDSIDDIDLLSYTEEDGKVYEDRFDYINITSLPVSVCFIGGTGNVNFSIPIANLTDQSLDILCKCIN